MPFPRIVALSLLTALLAPTTLAFHSATPASYEGASPGASWSIVTFQFPGGKLGVEVETDPSGEGAVGLGSATLQNGVMRDLLTTSFEMDHHALVVGAHPAPGVGASPSIVLGSRDPFTLGIASDRLSAPAGTYSLIGWASGDATELRWALRGTGITILSVTTGDRTFLATQRDFKGPLAADASTDRAGARVSGLVEHEVHVEDGLLGTFGRRSSADVMYADTPTARASCTCEFRGAPPGDYRLHVHGAGTTHALGYGFAFNAADLKLPS